MRHHITFVEKDSQKKLLKVETIKKLETITILHVNTEKKHMVYVV